MDEMVAWLTGVLDDIEGDEGYEHYADHGQHPPVMRRDPIPSVLALVEAARQLVALHCSGGQLCGGDLEEPSHWRDYCATCGSGEPHEYPTYWPCETLRWLAYGYRHDASGWRAAWAPTGAAVDQMFV